MEDCLVHNETKKRSGDELVPDSCSPEPKRSRVESVAQHPDLKQVDIVAEGSESERVDPATDTTESYRVDPVYNYSGRVDSVDNPESVSQEPESPDTIQLTDEILDILEDSDIDSPIQGLDSVIKSFEEEITTPTPLDYLLGASDDELGLPPAKSPSNKTPEIKSTESVTSPDLVLKQDFSFVDELPVYDPAEFGLGEDNYDRNEFVTLGDGLFDYSETPDYLWHPESLTAL